MDSLDSSTAAPTAAIPRTPTRPRALWVPARWQATPGLAVAAGLLVFGLLWLGHLQLTSRVPPFDSIEQLTWARGLAWGYYKHPPLPTWLIAGPVTWWGPAGWETALLGASMTLGALALMWQLLARLRGQRQAHIALLAALCITYYNGRLNYYNHNIVLLLASSASARLCWQAVRSRQRRWWLGLGLALGLGALAKYQIAVTGLCVLAFALHQGAWTDRDHQRGLLLAAATALILFVPHAIWLVRHDFAPLHYAMNSSLGAALGLGARLRDSLHWLLDQLLNRALPAWLLLGGLLVLARRGPTATRPAQQGPAPGDAARALLLIWGGLPLLFMFLLGVVTGADLQLQWGTAFLLFTVPAVMEWRTTVAWQQLSLRHAGLLFIGLQAVLMLVSTLTSPLGPARWRDHHWRSFDATGLARQIETPARRALGGSIALVIGPANEAGALALSLTDHPVVLIDNRLDWSSWVEPGLLARCGAVQLGPLSQLPRAVPLGAPLPGWGWQLLAPQPGQAACGTEPQAVPADDELSKALAVPTPPAA